MSALWSQEPGRNSRASELINKSSWEIGGTGWAGVVSVQLVQLLTALELEASVFYSSHLEILNHFYQGVPSCHSALGPENHVGEA